MPPEPVFYSIRELPEKRGKHLVYPTWKKRNEKWFKNKMRITIAVRFQWFYLNFGPLGKK